MGDNSDNKKYSGGQPYLRECRWSQITREERYFCQFLFNELNLPGKVKKFLSILRKADKLEGPWIPSETKEIKPREEERAKKVFRQSDSDWPDVAEGQWEVAYEAAFYRDLIYHCDGTGLTKKLVECYSEHSGMKDENSVKRALSKRTFDLCLFGPKDVVIIEAKADGTFGGKQLKSFNWDKELLKIWFEHLKLKVPPHIRLFGLVSSQYPKTTNAYDFTAEFDCIFSWKYLADSVGEKLFSKPAIEAFIQADETYKRARLGQLSK